MKPISYLTFAFMLLAAPFSGAYAQEQMHGNMKDMNHTHVSRAICIIYGANGSSVNGTVTFTQTPEGVRVVADVQGLSEGKHGFHIHEFGDCSASDASSAGGHFNPYMKAHGGPTDAMRHEGDMGNLVADASGKAHLEYIDHVMKMEGPASIIGRSIIIHAGADDLKSQPAGNAGARIACGVIGVAK